MKLVSYQIGDDVHYGAVKGSRIVDLSTRLRATHPDIVSFIGLDGLAVAREIVEDELGDLEYEEAQLLPVVPKPSKILCVGLNYHDHVNEANRAVGNRKATEHPMIFPRWSESLTAHRASILKPRVSNALDWEAELLVVMGQCTGRYVLRDEALNHVFGYACMNDGSLRDFQRHTSQFAPGKNFERTGAVGPWIVTADEIADPMNLDIEFRLNGQVMQKANTAQMIHSIAATIEYISQWIPLSPGDLIATGTMGGVGFARTPPIFMQPGDLAEVDIRDVGVLRNIIEAEPAESCQA